MRSFYKQRSRKLIILTLRKPIEKYLRRLERLLLSVRDGRLSYLNWRRVVFKNSGAIIGIIKVNHTFIFYYNLGTFYLKDWKQILDES